MALAKLLARLDELLPTMDLSVDTVKSILKKLTEDTGEDANAHKPAIKAAIHDWLDAHCPLPDDAAADDPPTKKAKLESNQDTTKPAPKQKAAAAKAGAKTAADREAAGGKQGGNAQDKGEAATAVDLGNSKKATVSELKGMKLVNLRQWYTKDGEQRPGKGISLTAQQWDALRDKQQEISAAFEAKDTAYSLNLSDKRKVTISNFNGKWLVDVREYYSKDGEMKPGAKGLAMSDVQWESLVAGLDTIDKQL